MNTALPPEISIQKELLQGCQIYNFRHVDLGDIGRIVVQIARYGRDEQEGLF